MKTLLSICLFWVLFLTLGFAVSWLITGLIFVLIVGALWFLLFFYPPLNTVEEYETQSSDPS